MAELWSKAGLTLLLEVPLLHFLLVPVRSWLGLAVSCGQAAAEKEERVPEPVGAMFLTAALDDLGRQQLYQGLLSWRRDLLFHMEKLRNERLKDTSKPQG